MRTAAVVLPDGEAHKDWETLARIFDMLLAERCERSTTLVALGGGVVGDMVASPQPATSAACPSSRCRPRCSRGRLSVGGKTAINHPSART